MSGLLLIALVAIIGFNALAKRGRGKKRAMSGYRKLPFQLTQSIGAITSDEFGGFNLPDAVSEKTWVSSVRASYGIHNFTVGEGPVLCYVAHSDYSDAEVAEYINSTSGWDTGNLIAREQASRKVRLIGNFQLTDQGEEVLVEGRAIHTKVGWMLETGATLQFGLFASGGTLTTGGTLTVTGFANGWAR